MSDYYHNSKIFNISLKENVGSKINYNTGDFVSDSEVVLQIPRDGELSCIEAGLLTIPGKPIPFSATHPKGGFKDKDMQTVFSQGIKLAETMGYAFIDYTGRQKIKVKLYINNSEIGALIKQDKVSISYAYWRDRSLPNVSVFEFDHLLLFPRKGGI